MRLSGGRLSQTLPCAVVALLAVAAAPFAAATLLAQRAGIVPYTVVLAETVSDREGRSIPGRTQTWALRSDGSTLLRIEDAASAAATIYFATGTRVEVSPSMRARSTVRIAPSPDRRLRDPRSRCLNNLAGEPYSAGDTQAGEETIGGYRAVKIVKASGAALWYAPDVGCALVRSELDFGSNGKSVSALVTLTRGEPSPDLFAVPDDYREGPPSSLSPEPPDCDAACKEQRKKLFEARDREYFANRPGAPGRPGRLESGGWATR